MLLAVVGESHETASVLLFYVSGFLGAVLLVRFNGEKIAFSAGQTLYTFLLYGRRTC